MDAKHANADPAALRLRTHAVLERLLRDGIAIAQADGTVHNLFPLSIGAAEGEALRRWVEREGANHTIEVGLG